MQEWYTIGDLEDMWGVPRRRIAASVRELRRAGVVKTTTNPRDEREVLVHRDGLDILKRALRVEDTTA